ncbi:hypothetical protein BaRGS_00010847 [Batillaria attramentaria]|uniref:Uncharacterized protein n=1 Tax=Batillaria attramentaria TaxID=370345 RepID=A0ABD0LF37_9CAEN
MPAVAAYTNVTNTMIELARGMNTLAAVTKRHCLSLVTACSRDGRSSTPMSRPSRWWRHPSRDGDLMSAGDRTQEDGSS